MIFLVKKLMITKSKVKKEELSELQMHLLLR
nr:MAG TPA: hypothetical protein [Bacteriophage sp.]